MSPSMWIPSFVLVAKYFQVGHCRIILRLGGGKWDRDLRHKVVAIRWQKPLLAGVPGGSSMSAQGLERGWSFCAAGLRDAKRSTAFRIRSTQP